MVNVTDMSRDQAKNYLRTLGEEAFPGWTALEIQFRLGEKAETELDRAQSSRSLVKKRPANPSSGPEESPVEFGRYKHRMFKDVPQPYLDFIMEAEREFPMELSAKVSRLAAWARSQKDTWTGKTPQLIVSGDGQDETADYRHRCKICYGTKAEVVCFFCRIPVCMECTRPCTGKLPQCLVCAGEMSSMEKQPANWAQKMEYAVETLMISVQALQAQTSDHETILARIAEVNPTVQGPEQEMLEISPTESPSPVLVDVEEGETVAIEGPREDPLGAFAEGSERRG